MKLQKLKKFLKVLNTFRQYQLIYLFDESNMKDRVSEQHLDLIKEFIEDEKF